MKIFNKNITFLRQREGFKSVQKFADHMGEPMGKVREYERRGQPKGEFLAKLVDEFNIDLHMFLTTELNDSNYSELFTPIRMVAEDRAEYGTNAEFLDLINQLNDADSPHLRKELLDKLTKIHFSQVDKLRDELVIAYKKAVEALEP